MQQLGNKKLKHSINIKSIVKSLIRKMFVSISSFLIIKLSNNRSLRGIIFDALPSGLLITSSMNKEKYIICSDDKFIAKSLFTTGEFELNKAFYALDILSVSSNQINLIDVGANIGTTCIPLVNRGLVKSAIAIEPEPFNFNLLSANIHLNDLSKLIIAKNLALGNKPNQELQLIINKKNHGDHRIKHVGDAISEESDIYLREVNSTTLDDLLADMNIITSLIWIDTQGHEGYVLAGATKTLKRKFPIVMEFWPYALKKTSSFDLFKSSLILAGYSYFYDLNQMNYKKNTFTPENMDSLIKKYSSSEIDYTDILIV